MAVNPFAAALAQYEQRAQPFDPGNVFDQLRYVPTVRQAEFHAATEFSVLYGGSAGGGKSKALLMEGVRRCIQHPGLRVGAFRRTYGELKESLLAELAQVDYARPVGAAWNGTEYELRFPNGSLLMFRYAENLQDATRRQGGQYQLLMFDELTLLQPDVPAFLESRLRSGRSDIPVIGVRASSNPGGPGHGEVRKRFIDATDHGNIVATDQRGRTVRFIQARAADNPHLNVEYQRDLDALPEAMRKAFRDGSWDAFAGQVFTEWDRARHVVPVFDVPADWARYAGIDWGYTAPWAVVWAAVDEDRRVWVYRERYATKVGEADQAARVLDAEAGENVVARYADDAMWTGRGAAKSVADIYAENDCHIVPAKKGERVAGWQRVHSHLADAPACMYHREQGWETCPRLHVLDGTAPNLVRTLPSLPYDTKAARLEDVDTKAEDHAPDALRYLLINLAEPSINGWLSNTDDPTSAAEAALFDPMASSPDWWHENDDVEEGPWGSGSGF